MGLFFGLAMTAAAGRTVFRVRNHRRLFLDDIFLLLACIFLTVATIIFYIALPQTYVKHSYWLSMRPDVQLKKVAWYQKMSLAYKPVTWAVIFAVKFSFISFFRVLVNRLRYMIIYWKIVVAVTAICFCFCASEVAMGCPHLDVQVRKSWGREFPPSRCLAVEIDENLFVHCAIVKCGVDKGLRRSLGVTTAAISLDIITDVLSSVPLLFLTDA